MGTGKGGSLLLLQCPTGVVCTVSHRGCHEMLLRHVCGMLPSAMCAGWMVIVWYGCRREDGSPAAALVPQVVLLRGLGASRPDGEGALTLCLAVSAFDHCQGTGRPWRQTGSLWR